MRKVTNSPLATVLGSLNLGFLSIGSVEAPAPGSVAGPLAALASSAAAFGKYDPREAALGLFMVADLSMVT